MTLLLSIFFWRSFPRIERVPEEVSLESRLKKSAARPRLTLTSRTGGGGGRAGVRERERERERERVTLWEGEGGERERERRESEGDHGRSNKIFFSLGRVPPCVAICVARARVREIERGIERAVKERKSDGAPEPKHTHTHTHTHKHTWCSRAPASSYVFVCVYMWIYPNERTCRK
jgi:hypothetical protein